MGLLSRRLGFQAMTVEDPAQPWLPYSAMVESLWLGRSDAGVLMNEHEAMRITTALACVKIISEDLGTVSREIMQKLPNHSFRVADDHRLWGMLHDQPNPNMTAAVFWGAFIASMLGWGAGYAWIKRDGAARATSLILLAAGKTSPVKVNGKLMFATTQTDTGAAVAIDPENILYVPYLTFDGVTPVSPIKNCKNAFGLAYAAEKFGAQLFGNGARATGVLSHPNTLEGEAYENLKKSVREWATGETALRPIILEEGMKWEQITINPEDAQFLATRQFQRVEIASLYRVAMHLLQDLQRATNNNIEHQSLDHVKHCLRPNAVKIEQEVNVKLLGGPFTMEHNLKDMQRGDFASQAAGFQTLRNIGAYSVDRILGEMRENPIGEAAGGNIRVVQGAFINLLSLLPGGGEGGGSTAPADASGPDESQPFDRLGPAFRVLMRDAVGRIINRENRDAKSVRNAFRPVVLAAVQASLAMRFGNATLTDRDFNEIDAILAQLEKAAPQWDRSQASALADRLTGLVYDTFAGGPGVRLLTPGT